MRKQKLYQKGFHKRKNKLLNVKKQAKYKGVHGKFKCVQERAEFMRQFPTKAEHHLSTILKRCKIPFESQYIYKRMIIDFHLPEYNLLIEVDGPSHYNTGEKDKRRDAFLQSKGFETLRLSNNEVLHDPQRCIKMIRAHSTIKIART